MSGVVAGRAFGPVAIAIQFVIAGVVAAQDIPPVGEFIEMIHDAGGQLYACKATVDMFHLTEDDFFIKIKPTIVNLLFASVLFSGLAFGQSLLKYALGEAFSLTEEGWRVLTIRWGLFFLFLAALNEIVWRNFSEDFWVSFKLWGLMPITMVFAMSQVSLLQRYEKHKS